MADLARIARPWLFSPRSPVRAPSLVLSSYLGLGCRQCISTTAACRSKRAASNNQSIPKQRRKAMEQDAVFSLLLPYTIVPPPISSYPRDPRKFAKMVWLIVKNRLAVLGGCLGVYALSMPGRFGWPRFRMRKSNCVPAGKSLHAEMSEAVAAGDKETLRRICKTELFQTLAGAIDSRAPGIRTEWELVRYERPMRYPRLADFRIMTQPASGGLVLVKQAVVSIASVQRLTRYDERKGGAKIPGSERERSMVEHIVLQADVNNSTYESGPWKIWGTLQEMSYETMRDDAALFSSLGPMRQRAD